MAIHLRVQCFGTVIQIYQIPAGSSVLLSNVGTVLPLGWKGCILYFPYIQHSLGDQNGCEKFRAQCCTTLIKLQHVVLSIKSHGNMWWCSATAGCSQNFRGRKGFNFEFHAKGMIPSLMNITQNQMYIGLSCNSRHTGLQLSKFHCDTWNLFPNKYEENIFKLLLSPHTMDFLPLSCEHIKKLHQKGLVKLAFPRPNTESTGIKLLAYLILPSNTIRIYNSNGTLP